MMYGKRALALILCLGSALAILSGIGGSLAPQANIARANPAGLATETATATPTGPLATLTATATAFGTPPTPTTTATPASAGTPPTDTTTATPTDTATLAPSASATSTPRPLPSACVPAWQLATAPTPPVVSLAVVADDDLWAIGGNPTTYGYTDTVILHGTGSTWQPVPPPTPAPPPGGSRNYDSLLAIAAHTSSDVWAAGFLDSGNDLNTPTILHWNGSAWTRLVGALDTGRRPAGGDTWIYSYNAIAIVGPNEMWTVGGDVAVHDPYLSGGTLVAHCTASGCSGGSAYNPDQTAALYGIAAANTNDIWAVGLYGRTYTSTGSSLIEHWNGTAWTVSPSPDIGILVGVAIDGPNDIWAVGPSGILHYDGIAWQQVPSPAGAQSVIAFARDDAWAVGTAILHWDGAAWSTVATPPGTLGTITALNESDLWAAGRTTQGGGLVEHATLAPFFTDVPASQPFYAYVQALACRGYVSGYGDRTYRPGADVTRGQLAKIIANTAGLADPIPPTQQTFADVPPGHPFWLPIEELAAHGAISGYACGGPGEPCDADHRPYFRSGANATRGQISKIVASAANLNEPVPPAQQTFADIPPSQPFWVWIERLAAHGIISGYACGGPGEPCDSAHRPYFRSGASTTRGQMAKLAALAFLSGQ